MKLPISGYEGGSLREATLAALIEWIRSGDVGAGGMLPAERDLAAKLGVSRGTLREAIRVLDSAGVLEVRTRSGTYLTETALSKGIELRAHAALSGEESPLDVMVARRALEPVCARYAALNRNVRELRTLTTSVDEQRQLVAQGADPDEVDRLFHIVLSQASRNPVLHMLFKQIADIMKQRTWQQLKGRSREKGGHQELYIHQHELIVEAIKRGDSAGAATAMLEHLDSVEDGLLAEVAV